MTLEEQLKEEILSKYKSVNAFTKQFNIPYSTLDSIFKRGIKNGGIDTMMKIFGALNLDIESIKTGKLKPNSNKPNENDSEFYTVDEQCLIKKYRTLDEYGKAAVDSILNIEHKRCAEQADSLRPMVMAAARSGAVSQIEEIHPNELPDNTPLP